ncbi:putative metallo-hydrolase [Ephemeroptericola cinctiostellae]|uniref:Putative metallo-hydrolase n=1 Tax=Ephemeroptericola cinctiostellae TaxID=2268024 RepID=A0A345DAT9_9BURK|nr:MBL fold metallo-hydrolase [Ephemeroptericola cinctiostellae]AXF85477.1 putative metallo-hydrolase [Ephemeroptericola cinctiostellae]
MTPQVQSFFDPATWTISHIIHHGMGSACAIVDSVLDYDPKSGRTRFDSADRLIQFIQEHDLKTEWILETHAHADHLSASAYLKKTVGGRIAMGEHIRMVQRAFKSIFNLKDEFKTDGSQFDVLFKDNEQFQIGDLTARVMFVPGHTPGCASYIVGDAVFVGDTIFMPDVGTARCDFPGGDALQLHQSIQRLLAMPDETKLYLCHDYPPNNGREPVVQTTVAAERAGNIHVHDGISATEFVEMRTARDANLAMPNLILPAIQVNIRAGEWPKAEDNGTHYLKIPLNVL